MKTQQTKNMEGKEMLKKLKTFIALAALSTTTVSANVQAATLTPQLGDQVHTLQVSTEENHNLWGKVLDSNLGVVQVTNWNHFINPFIHPSFIAFDNIVKQPAAAVSTPELAAVVKPAQAPAKVAPVAVPNIEPTPVINSAAPAAAAPVPVQQEAAPVKKVVTAPAPAPSPAPAAASVAAAPAAPSTETPEPADTNKEITVKATAYTASCEGCSGITATGVNIKDNPDEKVIAVDPDVIPLGSKVYVEGVGEATAADTGGAIKGNRIDVFIPTEKAAL